MRAVKKMMPIVRLIVANGLVLASLGLVGVLLLLAINGTEYILRHKELVLLIAVPFTVLCLYLAVCTFIESWRGIRDGDYARRRYFPRAMGCVVCTLVVLVAVAIGTAYGDQFLDGISAGYAEMDKRHQVDDVSPPNSTS